MAEPTGQVETTKDIGSDSRAVVRRWLAEIALADKEEETWRTEQAPKIVDKYRDADRGILAESGSTYNVLWSNTQVLKPALFGQTPKPDVRRRFTHTADGDPVGRQAAQALEKALVYNLDDYDFDDAIEDAIHDYLLVGRGQAWVVLDKPDTVPAEMQRVVLEERSTLQPDDTSLEEFFNGEEPVAPADVLTDEEGPYIESEVVPEEIKYQDLRCEYVDWEAYRQSPAKRWNKVRWVARYHDMNRAQLKAEFGRVGGNVTLALGPDSENKDAGDVEDFFKQARVWEIWDKDERERIFVSDGYPDAPLRKEPDPLGLKNFFPCPRPIYSVKQTTSMIPVPEYKLYQDQAIELDLVTARIDRVVDAIRVRGVYDAGVEEIGRMLEGEENKLIPAQDFRILVEKGGLDNLILWLPIEQLGKVLAVLYEQRDRLVQIIYEITGISDIIRGATDPEETASAQRLKGQFGALRLRPRQKEIQRFARDIIAIKGEIIAEKFHPDVLSDMTGMEISDEVLDLLQSDAARGFRTDIETDSTVSPDELAEKEAAVEYLTAVGAFVQSIGTAVESGMFPPELAAVMLMWASRRYKVSREIEDILEELGQQGAGDAGVGPGNLRPATAGPAPAPVAVA